MEVYKAMFGMGTYGSALSLPLVFNQEQFSVLFNQPPFNYIPGWGMHFGIILTLILLFCVPDSNELAKNFRPTFKWAAALAFLFVFSVLHFTQVTAFLYFATYKKESLFCYIQIAISFISACT